MFSFGVDVAPAAREIMAPPSNNVLDEEAQKRNTDCIYFLASPLTCKKGASCDYRHSEAARSNPRDCWYWKAGNCLNPRCSFRHLPLDGKSVLITSVASTSSAPAVQQLAPATAPSNKSKTPCYFFSQGYCAKSDKCLFMHGAHAMPRADVAVAVNGKALQNSGRPLIARKQNASTDGRPTASNGFRNFKVPNTKQETPQISSRLEKSISPERNGVLISSKHLEGEKQASVRGGRLYDAAHSQDDFFSEDCPFSEGSLDQSPLHSGSHQTESSESNSQSNSPAGNEPNCYKPQTGCFCSLFEVFSNRMADAIVLNSQKAEKWKKRSIIRDEQECSDDLRDHLMKRRKKNGLSTSLGDAEARSQQHSEVHLIQQRGKLLAKADDDGTKVGGEREGSAMLPFIKFGESMKQDSEQRGSSGGTSKKEALNFTGPKSLAQIKAEKMVFRKFASEAVGKHSLKSTNIEGAETAAASTKVKKPAEVTCVADVTCNLSGSPTSTNSALQSISGKEKQVTVLEFEGPKPLSLLLKRKREVDLDGNVTEATSGSLKAESSIEDSSRELEDGEVGDDSEKECKDERLHSISCPLLYVEDELEQMTSSSFREVEQSARAEAAKLHVDLPEELKSDADMEEAAYGDEDHDMVDDDDDDDDDFAKKLERLFALSSE